MCIHPQSIPGVTVLVSAALVAATTNALAFKGFDSASLRPVTETSEGGLKIVVFDVGQADAILLLTPNGDTCLIDSGKTNADGDVSSNT